MWKLSAAAIAMATAMALNVSAASAQTTRIEPRPYTGAMVTLEHGVRVYRPLPPTKRVIINPGGATPLQLGFNETNVYEYRKSYNYHKHDYENRGDAGRKVYGGYGYPYGYGRRGFRGGYGSRVHRGGGFR